MSTEGDEINCKAGHGSRAKTPQLVDIDLEEREKRGNLVNNWKENTMSDTTKGIPMENLAEYIEYLQDMLKIKDKQLVDKLTKEVKKLATECTDKGASMTVKGKNGDMSMMAGFHIVREQDNSVSISYSVHNIAIEMQDKRMVTENTRGDLQYTNQAVESQIANMEKYQQDKVFTSLRKMGLQIENFAGQRLCNNQNILSIQITGQNRRIDLSKKNQEEKMETERTEGGSSANTFDN